MAQPGFKDLGFGLRIQGVGLRVEGFAVFFVSERHTRIQAIDDKDSRIEAPGLINGW